MNNLAHLFSPYSINNLKLENRAVMPAIGTGYGGKDSAVTDQLIAYLERRARGGVGLIITEECAIDPRGKNMGREIGVWNDSFIPGLARLAEAVHRHGSKIALQIHHAGRETIEAVTGAKPEAPSELPSLIYNQPTEAMSIDRIHEIINAYAMGALRAKTAGMDAVEIHGAHGYLVHQFISPFSNKRTDEYGGSDENRARFYVEILKAAREKVGPDFPIIARISVEECIKGGFELEFTKWLAPRLVDAGASAIHASVGVYTTPGLLTIAASDTPEGFNLFRAREIKQAVKAPVIGVGRIIDPRMADEAIARGDADLISMGRQLLADPEVLVKAREGRWDDIRWCLGCNQGCIERLSFEFKATTCSINAECGREHEDLYKKADARKKVWVIGGGPAGLSAALAAARRGHAVSLFEREAVVGGQLVSASRPPHKEGFYRWVEWIVRQLKQMGVAVHESAAVTEAMLAGSRPDAVILAAGAAPLTPAIKGIGGNNVVEARDVLTGRVPLKGPAVILGGGYVGMETADFCIERGIGVTVVEMAKFPPVSSFPAHGYWLHRRLRKSGGALLLNTKITAIEGDAVIAEQDGKEMRIGPAALVVKAFGFSPERVLEGALKKLGIPFLEAGDVIKPRRLIEAVHEGNAAGVSI
ncbi:MAG TPA: FAD-dependent oxidoreductase [Spirochaetota bacterium]|nr:FAD-dependent oxidoreductase [Spirochaetota bacterium]